MDLVALKTFIDVMRLGSFAAVARTRNVNPSSVSRAILSLEKVLGARLFHRSTRQLAPTNVAVEYFERIRPLVEEIESASGSFESGRRPSGVLRITAPMTFARGNLFPLLPEFATKHPQLTFDLQLTDRVINLVDERIDVAIRTGKLSSSSLVATKLTELTYVICASPDYLARHGEPTIPTDLEHHHCLRYDLQGQGTHWQFRDQHGEVTSVRVPSRVVASDCVALRHCAVAGMGITVLPRWSLAQELMSAELVPILQDYECSPLDFDSAAWILYPSRSHVPLKVRAFVDFMKLKFRGASPAESQLPARQPRQVASMASGDDVTFATERKPRTAALHAASRAAMRGESEL